MSATHCIALSQIQEKGKQNATIWFSIVIVYRSGLIGHFCSGQWLRLVVVDFVGRMADRFNFLRIIGSSRWGILVLVHCIDWFWLIASIGFGRCSKRRIGQILLILFF